jgi:hypothetical protein
MPFTCQVNAKANYALVHGSGRVTAQEYLDIIEEMYAQPGFNPLMRNLVDLKDVTENLITLEALETTAKVSRFHPKARRAVIVGSKIDFHLAREHQTLLSLHSKSRTRLFQKASDALQYLNEGLPKEEHIG